MNNDQNNQNNPSIEEIGEKAIRFGAILVAAAIILFCFAYTKIESPLLQICLMKCNNVHIALA